MRIVGGADNVVRSTSLTSGRFGSALFAQDTTGLTVAGSRGAAWFLRGTTGARLSDNDILGADPLSGCLYLQGSGNLLTRNRLRGCGSGGLVVLAGSGNPPRRK